MANINWNVLGGVLPEFKTYKAVELGADALGKGLDSVGDMFGRWNREKAVGGLLSDRIAAKKARIDSLRERLDSLRQELSQAQASEESWKAQQLAINSDPTYKMSGYQSPASSMTGYRPNALDMFGVSANRSVRF